MSNAETWPERLEDAEARAEAAETELKRLMDYHAQCHGGTEHQLRARAEAAEKTLAEVYEVNVRVHDERDSLRAKLAATEEDYQQCYQAKRRAVQEGEVFIAQLTAANAEVVKWAKACEDLGAKLAAAEALASALQGKLSERSYLVNAEEQRDAALARVRELEAKDCGCAFKSFNHKAHCLKQSRVAALEEALDSVLENGHGKGCHEVMAHARRVLEGE